jgi:uncharacterized RDD family membrane protein YckC
MRFRELKQQSKKNQIKKEQPKKAHLARNVDRIKAFITDMFMIYAPILYIITYVFLGSKEAFQSSTIAPFLGVSLYGLAYVLLLVKLGQTPGKKAYGIKVVDAKTGKNLTYLQAIIRFVGFLFSATIVVGLLFPFYRKDNKMLHDLLAGSVVINDETVA